MNFVVFCLAVEIRYEGLSEYVIIYFYNPGEVVVIEPTSRDQLIVVERGGVLKNELAVGNDIYVRLTGDYSPQPVDLSLATLVSGLEINEETGVIESEEGAYLCKFSHTLTFMEGEEQITTEEFELEVVIVVVDSSNDDVKFLTGIEFEGKMLVTDSGDEDDRYTVDINGAKMLVYYDNSDTPEVIEVTEDMVVQGSFQTGDEFDQTIVLIKYSYTYLGNEYSIEAQYSRLDYVQYNVTLQYYNEEGEIVEYSSSLENADQFYLPSSIDGKEVVSWESEGEIYFSEGPIYVSGDITLIATLEPYTIVGKWSLVGINGTSIEEIEDLAENEHFRIDDFAEIFADIDGVVSFSGEVASGTWEKNIFQNRYEVAIPDSDLNFMVKSVEPNKMFIEINGYEYEYEKA